MIFGGLERSELKRTELNWTELNWVELNWAELSWTELEERGEGGREGGREEGRKDGWTEGRKAGREEHFFCRPHPPKVLGTSWFFMIFMWNRALARVSCAFCRPHLPKVIWTPHFLRFLCETELSPQSRPHFADPIFQKDSKRSIFYGLYVKPNFHYSPVRFLSVPSSKNVLTFFLQRYFYETELSLQFCAFFRRPLLHIETRNRGNIDSTSTTAKATSPEKTQGFAPETWWHDDLADMKVKMLGGKFAF